MTINIKPAGLVQRCVWDNYVYYILGGSNKEAEKILKDNEDLSICERDAFVIGLTKVIETDNLIHKFNTYIMDLLTNKSNKQNDLLLIRKKVFDAAIDKFVDKFPEYWEPSVRYKYSLNELNNYVNNIKNETENLEIHKVVDKNIVYEFYNSTQVKKLIKFNY